MKIKFLVLLAFASVLFFSAFKSVDSKDTVLNFIKSEYVSSSNSEELKSIMEDNFSDLFDEVHKIDIHSNQENLHYYAVYGLKNNEEIIELFKTSKENIENEMFPSITKTNFVIYCYWQIEQERCGSDPDWISIRCGVASKGCQSF